MADEDLTTSKERERLTPSQRFKGAKVGGANGKPNKEIRQYRFLGVPPEDPLKAQEWAFELLTVSMYHVATDASLTEKERRKEMRETARLLKDMVPHNRLSKAERAVTGDTARNMGQDGGAAAAPAAPVGRKSRRGRPSKKA